MLNYLRWIRCMLTALCMAVGSAANAQTQVLYEDFDATHLSGGGASYSFGGAGAVETSQGYNGVQGPSGFTFVNNFRRNMSLGNPAGATTLTVSNLPDHTHVKLGFLLAIIDSWDGGGDGQNDRFNVRVDGNTVFTHTFANFLLNPGVNTNSYPQSYSEGQAVRLRQNLGFSQHPSYADSAYDMHNEAAFESIAHTGTTMTIEFFASGEGWQGGEDESWAIDDVRVMVSGSTAAAVPEPTSILLMGPALLAVLLLSRRGCGAPMRRRSS